MTPVLRMQGAGKRYGRKWALTNCSLEIPSGRVVALVGPNGAGKTTLLQLAVGLLEPTVGEVSVLGHSPWDDAKKVLPRVGFLAQDRPLYASFTVAEMLEVGRRLNPRWDAAYALGRIQSLGIPLKQKVGRLSGGQQSQVALVMTLAKRPELLLLDEPVAALDPLARREFLQTLMETAAEGNITIVLSSHIIGDLERVCDYAVVLSSSEVQLAGDIDEIVRTHRLLVGGPCDEAALAHVHNVISASHTPRQTTVLVRLNGHLFGSSWQIEQVGLEEILLAYLAQPPGAIPTHHDSPVEVTA